MINILIGSFNLWLAWQIAGHAEYNYRHGNVITARWDCFAGFINVFFGIANFGIAILL